MHAATIIRWPGPNLLGMHDPVSVVFRGNFAAVVVRRSWTEY